MKSDSTTIDLLAERLKKLEEQNLRFKRAAAVLGTAAACLLLMGQSQPDGRVIEAQKFMIRDDNGTARAALMMGAKGPALAMYDGEGRVRAALSVLQEGPSFGLANDHGDLQAALALTSTGPSLILDDANGKLRAGLTLSQPRVELTLYGPNGKRQSIFGGTADGSSLILNDSSGKPQAELTAKVDGSARQSMACRRTPNPTRTARDRACLYTTTPESGG